MLKRKNFKCSIAIALVVALLITVFAPVCSAEEAVPTMPDLSEYSFITIDEIEPETTVDDIIEDTVFSANEEVDIYDSQGYLLLGSDYVGNGATIIISENSTIVEVYKIRLYGDLNCDGKINAADLVDFRRNLLEVEEPFDDTVADVKADGSCDILDLVRLKKNQVGSAQISQNRMYSYSSRFKWLDNMEVPFSVNGYEEVFEDFSVVSNDIDLSFNRYYNSNGTTNNMLGLGWMVSFEGNCITYNGNSKIVTVYGQTPIVFDLIDNEYVCSYSRATLTATDNGFVFVGEDGLTYTFNQDGYLISITDKNSNTVAIAVDTNGKIQKVTDSVGREYNYTYGENGLLSKITDCIGRTVNYAYDSSNRLSSVTGVLGTVTEQYEYNSNNKLIKISDAFGNRISGISYEDNSGIVSSVTDSEAVTTDYVYNDAFNSVSLLQDDVVIEEYVYNRYNYLTSSNTEDGLQQNLYCNAYGDVAICKNTDGSKVQYGYDKNGNPVKITTVSEDEIVTEKNKYDSNNNLLSTVTENETTVYTYDSMGNTLSVTKTDEENTESTDYTYTDNGLVHSSTTDNVTTTYSYDNNGYLSGETDTDGTSKTYSYNAVGWLECEVGAETTANYKYNLNGDTLRETKNNVVTSRTVYDDYGRIKQQISEAEYNSGYDQLNSAQQADVYSDNSAEVPVGVRYYYGEDGKLSQIKASCYTVATDSNQKVTSVTAGNTVLAQYNYTNDAKELLSSVQYANEQSISYNYDTDGNITSLYYGDTLAYSYTYNTEGTLTSKVNLIDNIRTDYTDDSITISNIAEDGTLAEIYSYDSEMLVELDLPVGTIGEEYYLAEDGEEADLERITENFNRQSFYTDYYENLVKYGAVAYYTTKNDEDAISKADIKKGSSNLLSSSYEYDDSNLPIGLTQTYNGIKNSYSYTYDDSGNITSITQTVGDEYVLGANELPPDDFENGIIVSASYEKRYYYDNFGQLVRVDDTGANQTVEFVYNGTSGNILAVKTYALSDKDAELGTPLSTKTFGYEQDGWTDLLKSVDGNALSYDALGNLTNYNGYTYTWEAGRRLTSISNDTNVYSYKYDDNGIRTQKTVNGITTYYTTVDGKITGQYDGTNTIYFRYNADNLLIGFNLNGTEYIYLKNIQGDIEGILDLNGNLVVEYTYDAWGKVLSVTGSLADTVGVINPMRYRDYYLDSETGYYYLQSRYYNPEFCRFINADNPSNVLLSKDNVVGINLFAYCNNSPVKYSDASGMSLLVIGGIALTAKEVITIAIGLTVTFAYVFNINGFRTNVNNAIAYSIDNLITSGKQIARKFKSLQGWVANTIAKLVATYATVTATTALPRIAKKYGNLKCKEAADAMKKELVKRKLPGAFVDLYFPRSFRGYVVSDRYGWNKAISYNGHHYGIFFNNKIYCNIYPEGVASGSWPKRFHAASDVGRRVTYIWF